MWGLQNLMHTLVPQEQSKMTKDERLPMSLGLNMVLNRHKINMKQEMVSLVLVLLLSDMQCFLFYCDPVM
jgi:nucleolar protein 58